MQLTSRDSVHALWSCPELDVVWADQEKWGFRGEIDFTCVKELENTRPALFGIKGTRWGFRGDLDFTCVKELENTRPALFGIKGTR